MVSVTERMLWLWHFPILSDSTSLVAWIHAKEFPHNYYVKIPASMAYIKLQKFRHLASVSNRQTDRRRTPGTLHETTIDSITVTVGLNTGILMSLLFCAAWIILMSCIVTAWRTAIARPNLDTMIDALIITEVFKMQDRKIRPPDIHNVPVYNMVLSSCTTL